MTPTSPTSFWACAAVLLVAVASDVLTRQIPNAVTLGGLFIGLAIHAGVGIVDGGMIGGLKGLGISLAGVFVCSLIPFIAWRRGEMGGGDVKLFAAIGAMVGPLVGFDVEAATFCISGLLLFPYRLVRHGAVRVALENFRIGMGNLFRKQDARVAYVTGPKLPPMIMAPTIGIAFVLTVLRHGGLR